MLAGYDIRNGRLILQNVGEAAGAPNAGLRPNWEPRVLVRLAVVALPLGIVMLLISLKSNIPRYFIEQDGGVTISVSSLRWRICLSPAIRSCRRLAEATEPRLAQYYAGGKTRRFCGLVLKLTAIVAVLGVAGLGITLIAGRTILTMLYRPEYAEHLSVFVWLVAGAGLGYVASVLGYTITAARYFRIQVPLFMLVMGAAWLTCKWLIPTSGLLGAAIALNIAAVVQIVGSLAIIGLAVRRLVRQAC